MSGNLEHQSVSRELKIFFIVEGAIFSVHFGVGFVFFIKMQQVFELNL
jgi:hypothetical protein